MLLFYGTLIQFAYTYIFTVLLCGRSCNCQYVGYKLGL